MHKFHNKPTAGYASKKEAKRALALKLMQSAGQIRNLREQVPFVLIPSQRDSFGKLVERPCSYIADFVYDEFSASHVGYRHVVEDCKGMRTPAYIIKRKLMLFLHKIRIRET
jgi:hypothetical protein